MVSGLSDRAIYLRVLAPFVGAAAALVMVSVGGMHALSGARAYVGGESLWSKARSQAVTTLRAQALPGGAAAPCTSFADTLAVPLGDRDARLALERSPPDRAAARVGFAGGGNDPDDVDRMIDLYLDFGALPPLREPIAAWRHGDELIEQLRALGQRICASSGANAAPSPADLAELDRLDAELVAAETRFSASLGRSARTVEQLLIAAVCLLALLLIAGSVWYVMRSLRAQFEQRDALLEANTRWELAAEVAGIGVFVHHRDDDTVELDARARALYGFAHEGVLRRTELAERVHPDDRAAMDALRRAPGGEPRGIRTGGEPQTVRTEPVEVLSRGPRQAQPERVENMRTGGESRTVRTEPVEVPSRGLRQAQPERVENMQTSGEPQTVRTEPVEVPSQGLRQAQPVRVENLAASEQPGPDAPLLARFRIVMPDGATRHLEAIGRVPPKAASSSLGWAKPAAVAPMIGVLRDVTDEVQTATLQAERDAAERSARARTEFLSRLSHELRTPLNAVLGLAQVLQLDTAEPLRPRQRQRIELMLQSGWHLLHLVDDVLDITDLDTGQLAVRNVATDLRATIDAALSQVEPERRRFEIRVDDRRPASVAPVLADAPRLQQVWGHLLSNACRFNTRGGTLTLRYREREDHVGIAIDDQGAGLTAEQLAQLFQPFKRLDPSADRPGAGLGLVIAKLLTEQMRGRIDVDSEPGRGSSFEVWLRRA